MVAHQLSLGLTLGGIGAGVGLGQGKGAHTVALCQHGQIFPLLGLGAIGHDGIAAQAVVGGHNVAGGGALLAQFLDADGAGQRIGARAAVLLGDAHTHDAQIKQLLDVLAGVLAGAVRFRRDGLDFLFGKLRHHLADQLMLTAQIEIHVVSPIFLLCFRTVLIKASSCRRQWPAACRWRRRSAPPAGG